MEDPVRRTLRSFLGMPEADIARVSPNIVKILSSYPRFQQYQIVAEVIDAKYCGAGIKKGQKYVFRSLPPLLIPEESDCPLCLRALGPLTSFVGNIMDRIAEGADPESGIFRTAECLDPGLEHGGLGKVHFRVYVRKPERVK